MPYATIEQLPDKIRNHLPIHAQEIYRNAFNHALIEYGDEIVAFKVAWNAVKKIYKKIPTGEWIRYR